MFLLVIFFLLLFTVSTGPLIYTLFIYPLILLIKTDTNPILLPAITDDELPGVSVIVSVDTDLQAEDLNQSLQSILNQDYPQEKISIIVATDVKDQWVDQVAAELSKLRITVVRPPRPMGRVLAVNFAVRQAQQAFLVLMDGKTRVNPDAFRIMMRSLHRPFVGVVSGRVVFECSNPVLKPILNIYQRLLHHQRIMETDFGTITVAEASLCALRREDYHPVDRTMSPGMVVPFDAACEGKRTVYEHRAVGVKNTDITVDFKPILAHALRIASFTKMFIKKLGSVKLQDFVLISISSGMIRWFSPYLLVLSFISTLFLSIFLTIFQVLLLFQVITGLLFLVFSVMDSFGKRIKGTEFFILTGYLFGAFLAAFYMVFVEKQHQLNE